MLLNEPALREILAPLADARTNLENLAHCTELSERQVLLVGHALRSVEAFERVLLEHAADEGANIREPAGS